MKNVMGMIMIELNWRSALDTSVNSQRNGQPNRETNCHENDTSLVVVN